MREIKFKNFKKNNILKRMLGKPKYVEVDSKGREIKFRAWWPTDKVMESWETILEERQLSMYFKPDERTILMQFTGLKDKNGKDVYEGDICRCATYASMSSEGKVPELPYEVYFDQGQWRIGGAALFAWNDKSEIIGNIYENPELLK